MPSTRRRFLGAAGSAGIAGLAGCLGSERPYSPGSDDASEWPMPGYDAGFSASNPDAAVPRDDVAVRWQTEIPTQPSGRPVVADGTVFVPTAAALVAYDLADGTERWRVGDQSPWPASPVVHGGTVYVGLGDAPSFQALDAADGSRVAAYETRDRVQAAPVPDVDGDGTLHALYVGDASGRVYKLDPASSTVEHHVDVFGAVTRLAFDLRLLVGTEGGELYTFYDAGDRLQGLWRRKLGGKVTGLAASDDGLFAATFGGPVYRLADGAHAGRSDWTDEDGSINLAVAGHDVVGTDGGGVAAMDPHTGDRRWELDGGYNAAPAVAGDLLVAGGGDVGERGSGFVAAYDLREGLASGLSGRERWRFETDEAVMEGVTVADGAVLAATQGADGPARLYVLDPA